MMKYSVWWNVLYDQMFHTMKCFIQRNVFYNEMFHMKWTKSSLNIFVIEMWSIEASAWMRKFLSHFRDISSLCLKFAGKVKATKECYHYMP